MFGPGNGDLMKCVSLSVVPMPWGAHRVYVLLESGRLLYQDVMVSKQGEVDPLSNDYWDVLDLQSADLPGGE